MTKDGGAKVGTGLRERIETRSTDLSAAERRVADYLATHSPDVAFLSALDLAEATGTSDATVVRTAKRLGYSGLAELKREVAISYVEQTHPTTRLRARLAHSSGADSGHVISTLVEEAKDRLDELRESFSGADFDKAVGLLAGSPQVVTFGVGLSGVAADYLATRLSRLGIRARCAASMGFALADDLLALGPGDVVVAFDPGRVMRELTVILDHASAVGAAVVLVTDSLQDRPELSAAVALRAPDSLSGYTGEVLTSLLLADALVLALGQGASDRAKHSSRVLTRLRRDLAGPLRPRRRR